MYSGLGGCILVDSNLGDWKTIHAGNTKMLIPLRSTCNSHWAAARTTRARQLLISSFMTLFPATWRLFGEFLPMLPLHL